MKKEENTPDIQDEHAYMPSKLIDQIDKFLEYRKSEEKRLEKLCDSWSFKNSKQLEYSEICRKAINEVEEKGYKTLLDAKKEIKSLDDRLKIAVDVLDKVESPEGIKPSDYMKLLVNIGRAAHAVHLAKANEEEAMVLSSRTLKKNEELTLSNDELLLENKEVTLENKELMAEIEELRLLNAGLKDRLKKSKKKAKVDRNKNPDEVLVESILVDTNAKLQKQVVDLQDIITGKTARIDSLQEDVKLLHRLVNEHGIKPWKKRYDEMKESKARAEKNHDLWVTRSNNTIKELKAEVKEWKEKSQIDAYSDDVDWKAKYNELARLKDESLIQLQGQIQELNTKLAVSKAGGIGLKIKGKEDEHQESVLILTGKVKHLEEALQNAESNTKFFQDELAVAREDNAQLNRDFAAYKSAYALRLNEKADLEVQVADLKSKLKLPKSNLVKKEKKDLGKELYDNRRLREQLGDANSTINQQEAQLKGYKEIVKEKDEQIDGLRKQLKIKTEEWLEQTKLVDKLQEASNAVEKSWQSLYKSKMAEMADNTRLRAQVKSLENKIAIWERSWADQEKETTEWKKKANEFNLKMCTALKEKNELEKVVKEFKAMVDKVSEDEFTVLLVEL